MPTSDLYKEFIQFLEAHSNPAQLASFKPSEELCVRAWELLERRKQHPLSVEDDVDLEQFLEFEHVMRLLRAGARRRPLLAELLADPVAFLIGGVVQVYPHRILRQLGP